MKTVAFVYGWSEGSWQSHKFRKLLKSMDYHPTNSVRDADIIIAHSLGCYLLPKEVKAGLIILIGPTYWPHRSLLYSVIQNLRVGMRNHQRNTNLLWWINKLAHNFMYIFLKPKASYDVITKMDAANLPKKAKGQKIILLRNLDDAFCHPGIQKLIPQARNYKFIEMPGDHEDCWLQPEKYIEIIQKELF